MLDGIGCDGQMIVDSLLEKGIGILNEDVVLIHDSIFGVFDGATSLTDDFLNNEFTGGYLAANIAGEVFKQNNDTLRNLAAKANAEIGNAMRIRGVNLKDKRYLWSTSAAVVRIGDTEFEWAQIGDCLVMLVYDDDTYEILTPGFDHDLETLQLWQKISHKTKETIHSALKDQILKIRAQMNITYGVLNGEKEALSFLHTGSKALYGVKNILIFTDGLFIPKENPELRDDFDLFFQLFQEGGLSNIKKYVRKMEGTDVDCRIYPRFKTHDDIAAVSLSV
jgi:serine/threonine protein phosphatase PrpC